MVKNFLDTSKNKLSEFEIKRLFIIKVMDKAQRLGKLNLKYLRTKLDLSPRQIKRYLKDFREKGELSLIHKNKYKTNTRVKAKELDESIVNLYKSVVREISVQRNDSSYLLSHKLFYDEFVEGKYEVSYDYVNRLLNKNYLITKNTKRKTKRILKRKMQLALKEQKELDINNQIKEMIDNYKMSFIEYREIKTIPYMKHKKDFGECVEIDACVDKWFSGEKFYLYSAVDSYTGKELATHIEKEETNKGYAILLNKVFKTCGAPKEIRTDRRTSFWNKDGGDTNLSYCLKQLEINIKTNSEPTFKPNVERSFKNKQDYFPLLFTKHNIKTLDEAQSICDLLTDEYNKRFAYKKEIMNNQFLKLNNKQIKDALFFKKVLTVHKGFYVYFENKALCVVNSKGQRCAIKDKITLRKNLLTNELFTIVDDKKYYFEEINEQMISDYISLMSDNEYAKIENERKKMIVKNRIISKQLNKKQSFLANWENSLKRREQLLNSK